MFWFSAIEIKKERLYQKSQYVILGLDPDRALRIDPVDQFSKGPASEAGRGTERSVMIRMDHYREEPESEASRAGTNWLIVHCYCQ